MVATHYDDDHLNGLRNLLERFGDFYQGCQIFDQGENGDIPANNEGPRDKKFDHQPSGRDNNYILYINVIDSNGFVRVTSDVHSAAQGGDKGWQPADFLVGKDVLWWGFDRPQSAPSITCIAANQYVFVEDGSTECIVASEYGSEDEKNAQSLAFLVKFNNFRYFIGGDLESSQEDALISTLNPAGDDSGRIHALKLSHHGSHYSSSDEFVKGLRPKVAIISNGPNNRYGHPHQQPVNYLIAASERPNGLQKCYVTGEDVRPEGRDTADISHAIFEIPGWPADRTKGGRHIVISVSAEQSQNPAHGENVANLTVCFKDEAAMGKKRKREPEAVVKRVVH